MVAKKRANFYGILLSLLMVISILALFNAKPQITGAAVTEIEKRNEGCIGGIPLDTCSNTKPLYCVDGQLRYNCYECGCNSGESCSDHGFCEILDKCADGSFYGECSTLIQGSFCDSGNIIKKCSLCGCGSGEVCEKDKCVKN